MKRRTSLLIAMAGLFGLLLAGPVIAAGGAVTIREADERYAFSPRAVYVNVGDSVTWTNDIDAPHNVTSDSGDELASDNFVEGDTFDHTFNATGTFDYHCTIHPYMKASVVVLGEGVTPPPTDASVVEGTPTEPGWLGLIGLALVGLVAGLLATHRIRVTH